MGKLIYHLFIKPNYAYDYLKEPKRFLSFIIPFMIMIVLLQGYPVVTLCVMMFAILWRVSPKFFDSKKYINKYGKKKNDEESEQDTVHPSS